MSYREAILAEQKHQREGNVGSDDDLRGKDEHRFPLFTPKPGTNCVRIMADGIAEVEVHFEPHHTDGSLKRFTCPGYRTCLFCTVPGRSEAKTLWSVPIIDRADGAVKSFDFTNWAIRRELNRLATKFGEWMEYDVIITRSGTGRDTRYRVESADKTPLTQAERQLELPDIQHHLRVESYDEILARLGIPRRK